MKTLLFTAVAAATLLPAAAMAQEDSSSTRRIEPYVGVMAGVHNYDNETSTEGIPPVGYKGRMVEGVAGVNYNVAGPLVLGVEGTVSKGVSGDIDWEYGVKGRFGARAGESGLIYASAGYQWVNGKGGWPDRKDWMYGAGVEVGPKEIGLGGVTGNSGVRLRVQLDTYDWDSFRPMAGVIFHF